MYGSVKGKTGKLRTPEYTYYDPYYYLPAFEDLGYNSARSFGGVLFSFGRQSLFFDRLFITTGATLGFVPGGLNVNIGDSYYGMQDSYTADVGYRMFGYFMINFNLGIGFLAFNVNVWKKNPFLRNFVGAVFNFSLNSFCLRLLVTANSFFMPSIDTLSQSRLVKKKLRFKRFHLHLNQNKKLMNKENSTLSQKLKQYAALVAPALAISGVVNAQSVYTDVNPDVVLNPSGSGDTYALDLNNDGTTDYVMIALQFSNGLVDGIIPTPYSTGNLNAIAGSVLTFGTTSCCIHMHLRKMIILMQT